ncbi:MAG: NAD-dependent protein deacylase [Holophagales bacterium]|jgi:NAD-dependent deacetylase|nr:NAD-dependent protein deacylase [Holophagales bacterium]
MTKSKPSLVILTGAGISAESGIRTFRSSDGLWEEHRIEDVATPMGFKRDPHLVQRFYNERRKQLAQVSPNAAHYALAELESAWLGSFLLITQNVDDLHDRAGSQSMLHMHGELLKVRCMSCNTVSRWETDVLPDSQCPVCLAVGKLRPHIVWFGETPLNMEIIYQTLEKSDYFAAIGTSGHVYPAAGFVQCVGPDCRTAEINLEPSIVNSAFKECRHGPATETVPVWAREMLSMQCN